MTSLMFLSRLWNDGQDVPRMKCNAPPLPAAAAAGEAEGPEPREGYLYFQGSGETLDLLGSEPDLDLKGAEGRLAADPP